MKTPRQGGSLQTFVRGASACAHMSVILWVCVYLCVDVHPFTRKSAQLLEGGTPNDKSR